jgi:O-antigen ligase
MMSAGSINAVAAVSDVRLSKGAHKSTEYYLAVLILVSSVFQLYLIPIGSLYVSIGLISAYVVLVYLLLATKHRFDRFYLSFGALFGLQALSIAWAVDRFAGFRDIVFGIPFLACFLLGRRLYLAHPKQALQAIKMYCLLGLVQTILVVLFRVIPAMEASFFHSEIAAPLVGPNALGQFFGVQADNIADVNKTGGILLNANVAGVWAAVSAFMAMAISTFTANPSERRIWFVIAAVHILGVLACGSKASLLILFLCPAVAAVALYFLELRSHAVRLLLVLLLVVLSISLIDIGWVLATETEFGRRALVASATRLVLWKFAAIKFVASPWLGLGYGGWQTQLEKFAGGLDAVGLSSKFPPHNGLIILWSNSGILAAVLGLVIVALLLQVALSPRSSKRAGRKLAFWSTCAVTFFYLQSLGENYGFLGEPHIQVPFAFFLGVVAAYSRLNRGVK